MKEITLLEIFLLAVLLLFVVGIPLAIAVWMITAKMRRKISATHQPRIIEENQPNNFILPEIAEDYDDSFKRCPVCKSTFTDLNLSFCLSDGAPLDLVVRQKQISKPPVTEILEKPYASVPTVYAKKDTDDLPPTVESPFLKDKT